MNIPTRLSEETIFLRRFGWLLAVAGFIVGNLITGGMWAAVTLDRTFLPASPTAWFSFKGAVLGFGFAMFSLVWWGGLKMERVMGAGFRHLGVAALLAILMVAGAEFTSRSFMARDLLWQAVRVRAGSSDYFAREVSLVRISDQYYRAAPPVEPGILVAGSSQMLHALDADLLERLTGLRVHRRATAGMFPVEMLAWREFLEYDESHILLLMLSGFDLGGRDRLYVNLIKPLVTPSGLSDVLDVADRSFLLQNWRGVIELWISSRLELWRSRDYMRYIMEHLATLKSDRVDARGDRTLLEQQKTGYLNLGTNPQMVALSERSFERFIEKSARHYSRIIIVQGSVNPDYAGDPGYVMLSDKARDLALNLQKRGLAKYIDRIDQHVELPSSMWIDNVHVNEQGRSRLTQLFADIILQNRNLHADNQP